MNARATRKVLVALPSRMIEEIDGCAFVEHRTRSDLIREALRRYIDNFQRTQATTYRPGEGARPQPLAVLPLSET